MSEKQIIRVAGFIHLGEPQRGEPSHLVVDSTRTWCGTIVDGISLRFNNDADGWVVDFDDLARVVDAVRKERAS